MFILFKVIFEELKDVDKDMKEIKEFFTENIISRFGEDSINYIIKD
jgi:hypothetical protein